MNIESITTSNDPNLPVVQVPIDALHPYPKHARRHPAGKLKKIVKSIQDIGLIMPVVVDEANVILSGHLRVAAFQTLGLQSIAAIPVRHLSRDQKAAFVLHANRIVEEGTWDRGVLKEELAFLVDINCALDLETTGFDIGEIDLAIGADDESEDEPQVPLPPTEPITQPGDVWILGEHRLLCGDCLNPENWTRLMRGERARTCITDPPFNVNIQGHVSSKGHAEFAMASGEMTPDEFTKFLGTALKNAIDCTQDGGLHLIAMDHGHLRELFAAADTLYGDYLNMIVWAKTNAGMGSFYRSRHELFLLYKVGKASHVNNVQLGRFGRNRSNVWSYAGANTFRKGRDKDLADHPTVKSTAMIADALLDTSNPGEVCIDGFGGSGTLILAAERTKRRARVIELEPKFCDVAVRRWEEMTGRKAVLERASQPGVIAPPAPTTPLLAPPDEEDQA